MTSAASMIDSHPRSGQVDTNLLSDTIDSLVEASRTARQCADACVHEPAPMTECIGANLDAADMCAASVSILIRLGDRDTVVAALEAAREALRVCAEDCRRHGSHLRHCTTCASVCEHAEDLCVQMSTALTTRTGSTPAVDPSRDRLSPGATLDAPSGAAEPNEPA